MTPLAIETITVNKVCIWRLNEFIAAVYGLDEFEGHLEATNDSCHDINVTGKPLGRWDRATVDEAIRQKGCEYYSLGRVLDDLCNLGHIPAGNYLIDISW